MFTLRPDNHSEDLATQRSLAFLSDWLESGEVGQTSRLGLIQVYVVNTDTSCKNFCKRDEGNVVEFGV